MRRWGDSWRCGNQRCVLLLSLHRLGVVEHLRSVYGPLVVVPGPGADVTLQLGEADRAGLDAVGVTHIAMLRQHAISAAFLPHLQVGRGGGQAWLSCVMCECTRHSPARPRR